MVSQKYTIDGISNAKLPGEAKLSAKSRHVFVTDHKPRGMSPAVI